MRAPERTLCYKSGRMIPFFIGFLTCLSAFFRSRCNLSLEILALRQQLGVLKRKNPRPRLRTQDRMFWVLLRRLWPAWSNVLVIVKPETVVAWHRAGFRLFWRLRSRPKNLGRPRVDAEVRTFIRRMVLPSSSVGSRLELACVAWYSLRPKLGHQFWHLQVHQP
jgi:hypothetical protein